MGAVEPEVEGFERQDHRPAVADGPHIRAKGSGAEMRMDTAGGGEKVN